MALWILVGLLAGALALRIGFVVAHFGDPERLWTDYARRGLRYHLARGLDYVTLALFLAAAVWTLWAMGGQDAQRLAKVFVAGLGASLLTRLYAHRFPRTNRPGAFAEAKIDLAVHLLMSLVAAVAFTAVAAVYFGWRE